MFLCMSVYRLFRGFVARNVYKKLQSEEREKLENERKAAVAIQRSGICFRFLFDKSITFIFYSLYPLWLLTCFGIYNTHSY